VADFPALYARFPLEPTLPSLRKVQGQRVHRLHRDHCVRVVVSPFRGGLIMDPVNVFDERPMTFPAQVVGYIVQRPLWYFPIISKIIFQR
jgi:hypothetical protein